ncbi:DUF4280 domain-containing protein [Apibacter muscae]|uniref:DUF4280 domain-containing protein n=1 Tax=Apibacter muscae TaxID=2509004 RepID=UPI0011ACE9A5|nr:DUF4280 domain-containing protein [Apibacter muscae]TWP24871.1 DUF4280 domain-containing protein [Apibacter muscae]
MSHPLTENTKLKCNKGTKETPLKVTSHSGLKINSLLKATEKDKEANTNIIPFGQCKLKPTSGGYLPCTPAIKQWEKTSPFSLNGMKKLTTDSFCMCATGGKVSPLTPPETFINVIEKSIQEENNNQNSDSTNNNSDSDIVIFSDDISQNRRD